MAPINVRVVNPTYSARVKRSKNPIKVASRSGIIMARKLSDLMDVDTSNVQDNYVMIYDAASQKYKFFDPDQLLSDALINGLPEGFIEYLNDVLNPQSLIDAVIDIYEYINSLTLGRLANVKESVDTASDTFLIRYDETAGKYEAVDPDEILSSAIDENGLPPEVLSYLNEVLIPEAFNNALQQLTSELRNLKLGDLANVNDLSVLDKYVIMYDADSAIYETVNPDEVLRASVTEETEEGLPNEFLDQLDEDLDNRIDVDAGEY
jgi:hypothetical protein